LAGGIAYAALRSGDRIGLAAFTDRIEHYLPPRRSRGHGWGVVRAAFEHVPEGHGTDLGAALAFANKVLKRRSVVLVLSDFLSPGAYEQALGALAARHRVHALLVHDPREAALPDVGLLTLRDAETGTLATVNAGALIASRRVEERLADLRRHGVKASAISTEEDAFLRLQTHFRSAL
jgi:uncharacterized protein (DUF58 family)